MSGILEGMRVVEGSAFVAAPLGGMTLAQLGADVIRFDPIGGGLDRGRWPITREGRSLFWAGLNKGKRSIAGRPQGVYGRLRATRPGEYLLLDTTTLDVFAMEPVTLRWVRAELRIGIELYCWWVTGLGLSPVAANCGTV